MVASGHLSILSKQSDNFLHVSCTYPTTGYAHGHWQNLAPQPTLSCAANIADLPTPIDPEGGYGHNLWPRFECPLSDIGIPVGFIPYYYCFTE